MTHQKLSLLWFSLAMAHLGIGALAHGWGKVVPVILGTQAIVMFVRCFRHENRKPGKLVSERAYEIARIGVPADYPITTMQAPDLAQALDERFGRS